MGELPCSTQYFEANKWSKLDHEDLEQLDKFDLKEMDLKWQVAMISMTLKKSKGNQERKRDTGNTRHKARDNERRPAKQDESKAMVTINEEGVDWTGHAEDDIEDYALMAFNSSNSGSETKISAKDKSGLGHGTQIHEGVLSYENEVLESVFDNRPSDIEDSHMNDRFVKVEGMHAVPPLMTGIYMPPKFDFGIDKSKFTYGPKQSKNGESNAKTSYLVSCEYNSSVDTLEFMPKPVESKPKAISKPKVWSDAPIIKEYELDRDDEYVFKATVEQEIPSCASINTVKHGLGYGYTQKGCFVCGSFSHLIRDCDFHEKRMAKQVELKTRKNKLNYQRNDTPVWNNVQRLNHKNKFVPTAILTKTSRFPVNAARQNFSSQAASTSTVKKVNTARQTVNAIRPRDNLFKSHAPIRRPFNRTIAPKAHFTNHKVNNAGDKTDNPHQTLKGKGIVDSGCSRHMTGNKAYLVEYQDFNGSHVSFGGSKGQITDTEYLVLSPDFKLHDENQVLLRVPRQNNMYSFNLENIVPSGDLACLIIKSIVDESNKWHRRLGHVNFKNLNKLVNGNLVRGLPSKPFQNDHTCVACHKGKQHKASCKGKLVSSISQLLQILQMDLFGPTSVRSINHKTYFLVITDNFSRFSYVFFLRTKDETSGILKDFIRQIENQLNQKVKTIRCDNGTEFKNRDIIEFCVSKGINREYNNARAPQQNEVAKRKNRTLIEVAKTMLAGSFLPNTFWAEAVSTACYVLNRVLVTKPQNKTPYELLTSKIPIISYIRPFGCHVTILNTIDHLGKFEEKSDEGFLVGYSLNSKAFRPVTTENKANKTVYPKEANNSAGTQENIDVGNSKIEAEHVQEYYVLPLWSSYTSIIKSSEENNRDEKLNTDTGSKPNKEPVDQEDQAFLKELKRLKRQEKEADDAVETLRKTFAQGAEDLLLQAGAARASSTNYIPNLEDIDEVPNDRIFTNASYDTKGAMADFTNLESTMNEELLQFKTQQVWILVDLPFRKKVIGIKYVYRNKKDERGIVVRNKARLVAQGHRQEKGIDYDEVFALVARLEAIRIFLAFASYMRFIVYQIDVKSAFLYGKIDEEVYVSQPSGFIDPKFPNKVYEVVKALYGLHQAFRDWYNTLSTFLVKSGYRRGIINNTLFIKKDQKDIMLKEDGIFISQDKYVVEILKKFDFMSVKTASTPIETKKPLVKDAEAADVDVHLYRSMIGSLMYLTAFRPDIMYAVCACSRFHVTPKTSHLQAVKRIFRYLKGQPKLGIWYPKESAFDPDAYSDSDYARANLDRKSTTGGLNIEEGNFNKLDDLVGEGADYVVNKERSTDKIKVLNAEAEGVSVAGETLSTATLAVSTEAKMGKELASLKKMAFGKDFSNPLMADSLPKTVWLSMHHVIAMKH
nr:retrovirus-related Pol polyprotein from transposon TNT 1-94 [Tanacetum cinerariifolium]